jgi:hypothetical protein
MIKIKLGESVPKAERHTDIGLLLATCSEASQGLTTAGESYVRFRTQFADTPGTNYEAESKAIEQAINNLLKLSKGLHYMAKHILEEFEIKARVEEVGQAKFFVLDLIVVDHKHFENIFNIIESFRDKENNERIELNIETNFEGIIKKDLDHPNPKVHYFLNTELHRASRESILQTVKEYLADKDSDDLTARIVYFLSLKKLAVEVDIDFDLWQLLPKHLRPLEIMGLGDSLYSGSKIPLTTSMKKIASIFRDKMVANTEISARIGCLEAKAWVNYPNLFESLLSRYIDL